MQQYSESGTIDITELGKIDDQMNLAFIKKIDDFFEYGFDIGGIKIADEPDQLGFTMAFNLFTNKFNVRFHRTYPSFSLVTCTVVPVGVTFAVSSLASIFTMASPLPLFPSAYVWILIAS